MLTHHICRWERDAFQSERPWGNHRSRIRDARPDYTDSEHKVSENKAWGRAGGPCNEEMVTEAEAAKPHEHSTHLLEPKWGRRFWDSKAVPLGVPAREPTCRKADAYCAEVLLNSFLPSPCPSSVLQVSSQQSLSCSFMLSLPQPRPGPSDPQALVQAFPVQFPALLAPERVLKESNIFPSDLFIFIMIFTASFNKSAIPKAPIHHLCSK